MATIKAVATLTLSNLMSLKVVSAPPGFGLQSEKINVTDLTNTNRMEYVARPQLEETDVTMLCEYNGTLASVGTSGTLVITSVDTASGSIANTITGYIQSAIPQPVDIGGERRLLQEVVFTPDGANT